MGIDDIPFWGRMAAELGNFWLDRHGARVCERRGHAWRDVKAVLVRGDGGVEELPRGAAQRCARCGAERRSDAV